MAKRKKRTKEQTMNFMNQGYSRNASCALSLIFTFLIFYNKSLHRKLKNNQQEPHSKSRTNSGAPKV